ncbi:MAG: septum formation initiator family protein [Verrucomicrobiota bacterium]
MNSRRIFIASYAVGVAILMVASTVWFLEAHADYRQLKAIEAANEQKLANAKKRLAEQEKILERLRNDPAYVEKVLRDKLKLARPGDVIFRFEDE